MKPVRCIPIFKEYIWGGTNLRKFYFEMDPPYNIAEAWVLSCNKDGESLVETEEKLSDFILKYDEHTLGENCLNFDMFPVLVKLIDAEQKLSVQVHPSDEYALKHENSYGKTEMWYIVDHEPDAFLYYGFNKKLTKKEYKDAILNNTIEDYLNKVYVKRGDVFFIEPGTIHAIGAGIVLAEVQQNSNITYRVYDYDRKDSDGNKRELHIDKALDVTNLDRTEVSTDSYVDDYECLTNYNYKNLAKCRYFTCDVYEVFGSIELVSDKSSFHHILCTKGLLDVFFDDHKIPLAEAQSIIIPANYGKYTVKGSGHLIKTVI